MAPALGESCSRFCGDVLSGVTDAKCSAPFASVLRCRQKAADPCATGACPTEDNAFSACILDYCDDHYMADACSTPL